MENFQISVRQKGQENFPVPLVLCLVLRWNFWFNINFFENYNATFIEHSFYPVKKQIASSRSHLATKSSWIFHQLSTESFVENPCVAIVNPQGFRPMKILIFWGFSGLTPSHKIWESSFLTDLYTDTNFSQLYAPIWTNVNVKSSATQILSEESSNPKQWGIDKFADSSTVTKRAKSSLLFFPRIPISPSYAVPVPLTCWNYSTKQYPIGLTNITLTHFRIIT